MTDRDILFRHTLLGVALGFAACTNSSAERGGLEHTVQRAFGFNRSDFGKGGAPTTTKSATKGTTKGVAQGGRGDRERMLDQVSADLDGDGARERVVITVRRWKDRRPRGGRVRVFPAGGTRPARAAGGIWQRRDLNPWKLAVGDVDGDGSLELLIGVYKKSPYDPVMAQRPFFYNWDGVRLVPKWLGSRLRRRFSDLALGDLDDDGRAELVALERAGKNKFCVQVYAWQSFGFVPRHEACTIGGRPLDGRATLIGRKRNGVYVRAVAGARPVRLRAVELNRQTRTPKQK
jgi:hypothetical protein